jgi:peptidoglycan/LPS O-acetylase OafA/YrhL
VDLFFVLSGFLVSSLIFKEHLQRGCFDWKRFIIRRGFKIYPAFFVMLGVTLLINAATGRGLPGGRLLLGECLFAQNYIGRVWGQTWSLAVEEHFYLMLPALLLFIPFRFIPSFFSVVAVACLAMRLRLWNVPFERDIHFTPTHLRIDSLLFGVVIAYWYNYFPVQFRVIVQKHRLSLLIGGVTLIYPALLLPMETTTFLYTAGFTCLYLGFGAILAVALVEGIPDNEMTRTLGLIGVHSYSIYLWHGAILLYLFFPPTPTYILASIGAGILAAYVIEQPMLRLRDRLFAKPLQV